MASRLPATFKSALAQCGLSLDEAASLLEVRRDTVASWSSGRRAIPVGVWDQIADLDKSINKRVDQELKRLKGAPFDPGLLISCSLEIPNAPNGAARAAGARLVLALLAQASII